MTPFDAFIWLLCGFSFGWLVGWFCVRVHCRSTSCTEMASIMTTDTEIIAALLAAVESMAQELERSQRRVTEMHQQLSEVFDERDALKQELEAAKSDAARYQYLTRKGFRYAEVNLGEHGEEREPYVEYRMTFWIPEPVGIEFDEQEDGWKVTDIDAAIDAAAGAAQKEQTND